MPSILFLRPRKVVSVFEKLGLVAGVPQRRSHIILTKPGSVVTLSVPEHDEVARGTLRALISKAGVAIKEFFGSLQSRSQ